MLGISTTNVRVGGFRKIIGAIASFIWGAATTKNWGESTSQTWG
jgi:hypothetical protein